MKRLVVVLGSRGGWKRVDVVDDPLPGHPEADAALRGVQSYEQRAIGRTDPGVTLRFFPGAIEFRREDE